MSEFQKHLYLILHPNEALVASQLSPEEFGSHYSIGSPRHFTGKVIFAEVDINYREEFLRIDEYLAQTESGIPGKPKRTKFVKSYRVLEHIDLAALRKLYLVTTDGAVLGLEQSTEPRRPRAAGPRPRLPGDLPAAPHRGVQPGAAAVRRLHHGRARGRRAPRRSSSRSGTSTPRPSSSATTWCRSAWARCRT